MSSVDDDPHVTVPRWQALPSREEIRRRRQAEQQSQERLARISRQPKRVEMRLGSEGEFVRPGDDPKAWHGRRLFLNAIPQVKPQVLRDLAGEPFAAFFPDFVRLAGEGSFARYLMHQARWTSWFIPDDGQENSPLLFGEPVPSPAFLREGRQARLDVLRRWAVRWDVGDWWCVLVAGKTVLNWCEEQFRQDVERLKEELEREPDHRSESYATFAWSAQCSIGPVDWSHYNSVDYFALAADEKLITFPDFDWEPQMELRLEAEKRIEGDLRRLLASQLDRIEDAAARAGLERAPRKDSGDVHFWWLARWQVGHESYARIAKDPGIDRSDGLTPEAVRHAIIAAASLIGLTRRKPDRGGAPRKPRPPRTVVVKDRPR
jgi:hypothetical protein